MSLAQLRGASSPRNTPLSKAIRVTVIKRKEEGSEKCMFAVADKSGVIKAASYESSVADQLAVGNTYVIRNFSMGRNVVLLKSATSIVKSHQEIPDHIRAQAMNLIDPPTPERKSVEDIRRDAGSSSLVSLMGTVQQVNVIKRNAELLLIRSKHTNIFSALYTI